MADLEGAGGETLNRLKELVRQVESAHQKLGALGEKVADEASRVQDEWARMSEQVGSLLEAVAEQQGRLAGEVQEANEALSQLAGHAGEAEGEARSELDGGRQEVSGFADQVTAAEPTVSALSDSVEAAFRALSAQAAQVQEQLEKAVEGARDFLQDQVAADLRKMQEQIRDRGEAAAEALGECADDLRESYEDWSSGLDEVQAKVEQAFADVAEHLEQNVDLIFDECQDRHSAGLDEFASQIQELQSVLAELGEAAGTCGDTTEEAAGRHEGQMQDAQSGLLAVQAKLDEVKALLARYTFVQM